jgi:putative ABC transport system substrate-binding protein
MFTPGVSGAERDGPVRIGALTISWGPTPMIAGLKDGLLKLGYQEDKDFFLGVRFTQGDIGALDTAARELVQHGVDLMIVDTDAEAKAAQRATRQIPIVFLSVHDPMGQDLVQSFARPGGDMTGVTSMELHLGPKRLQLFQEMIPTLKRVLAPYDSADAYAAGLAKVYREAAQRLGIELLEKELRTRAEARAFFTQLRQGEVDGILVPSSSALNIPGLILEAAAQQAIPTMYGGAFFPEQGGLASYGPDYHESGRQAARLVDKILKGVDPAEIPVEVNSQIEFIINLKTAKALGLTIPPLVLFQADKIIR